MAQSAKVTNSHEEKAMFDRVGLLIPHESHIPLASNPANIPERIAIEIRIRLYIPGRAVENRPVFDIIIVYKSQ